MEHHAQHESSAGGQRYAGLMLATLGVVYGDIGTSPLYAFRECFHEAHELAPDRANILGILSLIFWALMIVLSVKYLAIVMRADNEGEGGILALLALLRRKAKVAAARRPLLVILGLFGAALLYGDGMITPAISVLSAVEGLSVATPVFDPYVVPITVVILILLFAFQYKGTARIGLIFGPVTLVWFLYLGVLGFATILRQPATLLALDPRLGLGFLWNHGAGALLPIGAVFLAVTGAEALYADMGHFGKSAIRRTWFAVVLPCLLLNYFGQGALLLDHPEAVSNPFFLLVPTWALYPTVIMACFATIIASQAVISGAFSLTRQAVRLGYLPRIRILHTSKDEIGQIYVPAINWFLLVASVVLAITFGNSSGLAAAYGIAVSATMLITTILVFVLMRERWQWPLWAALGATVPFLIVDIVFLIANSLKILHGGWIPILVGILGYIAMSTWRRGRELLALRIAEQSGSLSDLRQDMGEHPPVMVPGTAIFLTRTPEGTPATLLQNMRHNRVLHEQNLFLTLVTEDRPRVRRDERIQVSRLGDHFTRVIGHYGFMEEPNMFHILARCADEGVEVDPESATFFLGRETLFATERPGMPLWRERLFASIARNSVPAPREFHIPPERVIEIGTHIEL